MESNKGMEMRSGKRKGQGVDSGSGAAAAASPDVKPDTRVLEMLRPAQVTPSLDDGSLTEDAVSSVVVQAAGSPGLGPMGPESGDGADQTEVLRVFRDKSLVEGLSLARGQLAKSYHIWERYDAAAWRVARDEFERMIRRDALLHLVDFVGSQVYRLLSVLASARGLGKLETLSNADFIKFVDSQFGTTHRFAVVRKLQDLKMTVSRVDFVATASYAVKFQAVLDSCALDARPDNAEVCKQFLNGLAPQLLHDRVKYRDGEVDNRNYGALVAATLNEAQSLVESMEMLGIGTHSGKRESGRDGQPRPPRGCYNCGKSGHIARACREPPRADPHAKRVRKCYNCGEVGHKSTECTKPRVVGATPTAKQGSDRSPRGDVTCYNCQQKGHIARNCPTAKPAPPVSSFAAALPGVPSMGFNMVFPVTVHLGGGNNRVCQALYDTGADCSVVATGLFDAWTALGLPFRRHPIKVNTLGAGVPVEYAITIPVSLPGVGGRVTRIDVDFLVADLQTAGGGAFGMLLGRSALSSAGVVDAFKRVLAVPTTHAPTPAPTHVKCFALRVQPRVPARAPPVLSGAVAPGPRVCVGRVTVAQEGRETEFLDPGGLMERTNDARDRDPELVEPIRKLMEEFKTVFTAELQGKPAKLEPMVIELLPGKMPRHQPPRRVSPAMMETLRDQLAELMEKKVIRRCARSACAAPTVFVGKKDGTKRMCVDYRMLNDCTVPMLYPMPSREGMISRLGGNKFFAVMDLQSGFHQMPVHPSAVPLTAFATPLGLFEYLRMPFGLRNAPAYFQQAMENTFSGMLHHGVEVYIDDIVVYAKTREEFLKTLRAVLERAQSTGLSIKASKCHMGLTEVEFLGHIVNGDGVRPSASRRFAIHAMLPPTSIDKLRSFLGMANYLREWVPNYSVVAKPLTRLTAKAVPFVWSQSCQNAFDTIRDAVWRAPMLYHPNYEWPLYLRTDASTAGVGAVLYQHDPSFPEPDPKGSVASPGYRPIAYISRSFHGAECNWATIEQEAFGVYFAITSFQHFLQGHKFVLETDHKNLVYMDKATSAKLVRWRLALQEYDYEIRHIAGKSNFEADALSRCFLLAGSDINKRIAECHNAVIGHFGVKRTVKLLREKYVDGWGGTRSDVQAFCRACPVCQKTRLGPTPVLAEVCTTTVTEPFECVAFDTIGPLDEDEDGFKFVIVAIDVFSRFVELWAAHSTGSAETVDFMLSLFGRYGAPESVRTDGCTQFCSKLVDDFCAALQINKEVTIPYRPQSNGIVERVIGEVTRHLRALMLESRERSWRSLLPMVQHIVNSAPHTSTGLAPVQLMFGGAVTPGRGLFRPFARAVMAEDSEELGGQDEFGERGPVVLVGTGGGEPENSGDAKPTECSPCAPGVPRVACSPGPVEPVPLSGPGARVGSEIRGMARASPWPVPILTDGSVPAGRQGPAPVGDGSHVVAVVPGRSVRAPAWPEVVPTGERPRVATPAVRVPDVGRLTVQPAGECSRVGQPVEAAPKSGVGVPMVNPVGPRPHSVQPFGGESRHDIGVPLAKPVGALPHAARPVPVVASVETSYADYVVRLAENYKRLVARALAVQDAVIQQRVAAGPEPGTELTSYKRGDLVLLRPPVDYNGKPKVRKLAPRWWGPYVVVKQTSSARYKIQNMRRPDEVVECHVDRLKLFINGSDRLPAEIAGWDAGEFVVERILDARGPKNGRPLRLLEFLIRWQGYGPEADSWEPYAVVSDLEALDEFALTRPELHLLEGECGARRRGRGRRSEIP